MSVIAAPSCDVALLLERLCIATVSLFEHCCASSVWLGEFSPKRKIRTSGLWQEQHLSGHALKVADLQVLNGQALCPKAAQCLAAKPYVLRLKEPTVPHRNGLAHGKPPQFAILNHAAVDSGILRVL